MIMDRETADRVVNQAIDILIEKDRDLLTLGVTKRALSHCLAHYLSLSESIERPLVVDCEYNRHLEDVKRLHLPPRETTDRELKATTVFPDIIIHQRNTDANNFVVLELKKPHEDIEYDEHKLRAFKQELGYLHAAHVILGCDNKGAIVKEIKWIE